jgi:hypothetical protein
MTRQQRRRHVVMWAIVGPIAAAGLAGAWAARRPIPLQPPVEPVLPTPQGSAIDQPRPSPSP